MDRVLTGRPMPRKVTYFTPEPRSGLVLATFGDQVVHSS
jgi:uncharacterized protein (DUF1015 family)